MAPISFISDFLFGERRRKRALRKLNAGVDQISHGNLAEAITILNGARGDDADNPVILANLGAAYVFSQRFEEAEHVLRDALHLDPTHWPALMNLSELLIKAGRSDDAIMRFKAAGQLAALPDEVRLAYARTLLSVNDFPSAYTALRRPVPTLRLNPTYWLYYGIACQFMGLISQAEAAIRQTIRLGSDSPELRARQGRLAGELGRYGSARGTLTREVLVRGDSAEIGTAYARILTSGKGRSAAIRIYREILAADPHNLEVMTNLGNLLKLDSDYDAAEQLYRKVLQVSTRNGIVHKNLGDLLLRSLRIEDGISELRKATECDPGNPYLLSDLIFAEHYAQPEAGKEVPPSIQRWHELFGKNISLELGRHAKPRQTSNRIRIGLLSGSFRRHPVGFLALPVLEALDRSRFSIFSYANQVDRDAYTDRFQRLSDQWKPVAHLKDDELTRLIRNDRIDVLLEMSGHGVGHRLPVVAGRVAPVQMKWIGGQYNTMGIDAMDYFISDPIETPESLEHGFREKVLKLPTTYAGYQAPPYAPDVSSLPALSNGHLTFGSLNKINKINDLTVGLWAACLNAVPTSRLLLRTEGFGDPSIVQRCEEKFAAHGVEASRLDLRDVAPHAEALATYHEIDIALDPHPYSGCLTTCEALWMGVPVLTWPEHTFAGRHSASFLTTLGLEQWIALDSEDYVKRLIEFSNDLSRLSDLRSGLRPKVAASPLCDFQNIARELEICITDAVVGQNY